MLINPKIIYKTGDGYIKYTDGTMICYYTQDITTSISTSWGNLYMSNALTLNDFSQSFISIPSTQINVTGSGSSAFSINETASTTRNPGKIRLVRPQTSSSGTYKINVLAIGKWK